MSMARQQMLLSLVGCLCLSAWVSAQCGTPSFKSDAPTKVEARFKQTVRRGKTHFDYSKIEILWQPFLMVEDPACIEKDQLNLEMKAGDGNWIAVEESPMELGGGRYRWTVDAVPCKDHYIKLWVNGAGGQASLEYPEPILAASNEEIIDSGFIPEMPTNLLVEVLNEKSVKVSWTPADCATSYDISYGKVLAQDKQSKFVLASDGNAIVLTDGLEPCSDFSLSMFSVIGDDGYSYDEAATTFATPPDASAADKLDPFIASETNSMIASWKAFDRLSCVQSYAVSVCKEGSACEASQTVQRDDTLNTLQYKTAGLAECSSYTVHIQPLYPGLDLVPKVVDFRTKSPPVNDVTNKLLPVTAEKGEGQAIHVSWAAVQCAEQYEVFQMVNSGNSDWELVGKTHENHIMLNGVPCTEYRYGVQVSIDGIKSDIVEVEEAIMTALDNSQPFAVPNLEIDPTADGALLTWDHGACISSYVVTACTQEAADRVCEKTIIEEDSATHNISHHIANLRPCTEYSVDIYPIVDGEEFQASTTAFRTAHPAATAPAEYRAVLNPAGNQVELSWSQVECASGYKILQMIENSGTTSVWETDDNNRLSTTFQDPEPCVKYSYGVAAVVGGTESEPTQFQEVSVPPRQGATHLPSFAMKESANDTLAFVINPSSSNLKCEVEQYHVKYNDPSQGAEEEYLSSPLEEGRILLKVPGAPRLDIHLEGRIKYAGFETWSPWIKASDPTIGSTEKLTENSMLVPIIIGILVGIVVIVVIVFFVIKRKKTATKYDAEKASDNKDETQKLNDHPDA